MEYVNRPAALPPGITHHTFYSRLYGHALGYCVYLPPGGARYPVVYHLHGWQGSEATEIQTMAAVCAERQAITVFPNSSPVIEDRDSLPVEAMLIGELLPHIDETYPTLAARAGRSLSGFSMGGGMALYCAARRPDLFAAVTPYAGTFHHFYHKAYRGVGEPADRAPALYADMLAQMDSLDEANILRVIARNADSIRGRLQIDLRIGADDPLICDNEIMRLYLTDRGIPHTYTVVAGAGHTLGKIL